jgi:hypothetical protein
MKIKHKSGSMQLTLRQKHKPKKKVWFIFAMLQESIQSKSLGVHTLQKERR